MIEREMALLALRFIEIEAELRELADGRVVDGDPATVEGKLLEEQDEIEFELGVEYFEGPGRDVFQSGE